MKQWSVIVTVGVLWAVMWVAHAPAYILFPGDGSDEPGFVPPVVGQPPPPPPARMSSGEAYIPYPPPPVVL